MSRAVALLLLVAVAAGSLLARSPDFGEFRAVQESLSSVPPKFRAEWLLKRGLDASRYTEYHRPESTGLRLVGKYGRGPSTELTGRGNLVALALGSEVVLLNFANPDSPVVLCEIQLSFTPVQAALVDSFLLTCGNQIEVWNIADSTHPVFRHVIPYSVFDLAVVDTFLFFASQDTFRAYSIANAANPYQLGLCIDSGYVVTATRNVAVAREPNNALGFIDVSNPATPRAVGSYPCGVVLSAAARGSLVCASYEEASYPYPTRFITLDITDPTSPYQLGRINNAGGFDIFLDSALAFVSGRGPGVENPRPFQILNIADSTRPVLIDTCHTSDRYHYGVWANLGMHRALVADECDGLAIVDISDINNPVLDTHVVVAASAGDVSIDGHYCYVADGMAGLRILDVADPSEPREIGALDTTWEGMESYSVAAQDSFAFLGWNNPYLRVADVTNPANPVVAGGCQAVEGWPKAMALRDSFLYLALDYQFEVLNIARPREPQVMGTLALPEHSREVILSDTLAYVATLAGAVAVSIARPQNPYVVGTWPRVAAGIDLRDTILYVVTSNGSEDVLLSLSVANPTAPYVLDSVVVPGIMHDVVVVDTIAYCAGYRTDMIAVNVADPSVLRVIGSVWSPPGWVRRLVYSPPHIYACCVGAGVCILETLQTAVAEPKQVDGEQARKGASVVRGVLFTPEARGEKREARSELRDISGRKVAELHPGANDVRRLSPGVYFIREEPQATNLKPQAVHKVILTR
ncbi:MAG: hypothetical protein NTX53_11675 [candidate division WOR-3 bacterium]|nr:hypothetical protein [candidate division WOR-3 bacterium]